MNSLEKLRKIRARQTLQNGQQAVTAPLPVPSQKPVQHPKRSPVLEEPIVISTSIVDRLMSRGKDGVVLLGLYCWYYRKAREQKTNQPWLVNTHAAEKTHLCPKTFKRLKAQLRNMGLIQTVHKPEHWYVKVNYLWRRTKTAVFVPALQSTGVKSTPVNNTTGAKSSLVQNLPPNACSVVTKNASEEKIKIKQAISHPNLSETAVSPSQNTQGLSENTGESPVASYQDFLNVLLTFLVPAGIPKDLVIAIAEADEQFFRLKGYPRIYWHKHAEFWKSRVFDKETGQVRQGYRDLLKVWAEYCRAWKTGLNKYPPKKEFGKVTEQEVEVLLSRISKSKQKYVDSDPWWILNKFVTHYVQNNDEIRMSFSLLVTGKAWDYFDYDEEASEG